MAYTMWEVNAFYFKFRKRVNNEIGLSGVVSRLWTIFCKYTKLKPYLLAYVYNLAKKIRKLTFTLARWLQILHVFTKVIEIADASWPSGFFKRNSTIILHSLETIDSFHQFYDLSCSSASFHQLRVINCSMIWLTISASTK